MDTNQEKILQLVGNEDFLKKLADANNAEEAQALFEENGVELQLKDVEAIGNIIEKVASGEISADVLEKAANGELSEEELEQVSGGIIELTGFAIALMISVGVTAAGGSTLGVLTTIKRWRW